MERAATVFVYGSLRRGEANHFMIASAAFRGEARTAPRYRLVDLGPYPGLVEGGATSVVGELYDVDATLLAVLDRFEGHPELYRRGEVELASGARAFAYFFPPRGAKGKREVASGDWTRRGAGAPDGA